MNTKICNDHLLSAKTLHLRNQNRNFLTVVIMSNQTFISQINRVVRPLGEKLDLFGPLGFETKRDCDHKTFKIKLHSIRTSQRYLNDKNPMYSREITSIFRFNAESFESDFNLVTPGKTSTTIAHRSFFGIFLTIVTFMNLPLVKMKKLWEKTTIYGFLGYIFGKYLYILSCETEISMGNFCHLQV